MKILTKKLLLCLSFFGTAPLALFLCFYFFVFSQKGQVLGEARAVIPAVVSSNIFSGLADNTGAVAPVIISGEAVPVVIEKYLTHYQSPLLPFKDKILQSAERYGVDPRLIVAIAQQESNLGKKTPEGCYNAWGWCIHARGTTCFSGWDEAIETVTKGISRDYCSKGYCEDPCLMMKRYTPRSNGSWCAGVNQFLEELQTGNF